MTRSPSTSVLTLGTLFGLAALLASRLVLLAHEFIGHGGAAWVLGGELRDHRLFLFGGGWVLTRVPERTLTTDIVVSMGGVVLELLLAAGVLLWLRRRERSGVVSVSALIFSGVCFIHLGVYLCLGTHYGYGDGRLLHNHLGALRPVAIAVTGVVAIGCAFWLTRAVRRSLSPSIEARGRWRGAAALVIAVAIGAALHGSLMLGERLIVSDPTYEETMRHEAERRARRQAAREAAALARAGAAPAPEATAARARQLADRERPFPLRWPLYILVSLAAVAGFAGRARPTTPERARPPPPAIRWRDLRVLAIATGLAIASVASVWSPWWRGLG